MSAVLLTAPLVQWKLFALVEIVPFPTPPSMFPPSASTSSTNWIVPSALLNTSLTPRCVGRRSQARLRPNRQARPGSAWRGSSSCTPLAALGERGRLGRQLVSHSNRCDPIGDLPGGGASRPRPGPEEAGCWRRSHLSVRRGVRSGRAGTYAPCRSRNALTSPAVAARARSLARRRIVGATRSTLRTRRPPGDLPAPCTSPISVPEAPPRTRRAALTARAQIVAFARTISRRPSAAKSPECRRGAATPSSAPSPSARTSRESATAAPTRRRRGELRAARDRGGHSFEPPDRDRGPSVTHPGESPASRSATADRARAGSRARDAAPPSRRAPSRRCATAATGAAVAFFPFTGVLDRRLDGRRGGCAA